jgi:hypothetical protein
MSKADERVAAACVVAPTQGNTKQEAKWRNLDLEEIESTNHEQTASRRRLWR